jgi:hypothetical protein
MQHTALRNCHCRTLVHNLALDTHRLLRKRRQANTMSKPFIRIMHIVIADSGMGRHSVVPDTHGAIVPFDANLEISRDGNVL